VSDALAASGAPAKAGRREWIGLAVIALPCMLYSLDLTALFLAVPALTRDLRPSSAQLLWITDIYGFLLAGCLITMGRLGDRIGRRRLLLIGAAAFGAASLLAAFSTSAGMLIAARGLLGVAGATLAPSTLSLISNMFADEGERRIAISVWITSFSAGGAIGPLVGGVLLEYFWWGSVFLIAVPVMALLLILGPVLLPEFRDPDPGRLDLPSAALATAAVLAVTYSLQQVAQQGAGWQPALAIVAGFVLAVVFARRQRVLTHPLIDLRLFRIRAFNSALAANTVSLFAVFGIDLFTAQYLQLVLGYSPLRAGLYGLPAAFGFIVGSSAALVVARRITAGLVVAIGLALAGIGLAALTQVGGAHALAILITASTVIAIGVAGAVTLSTDLIVGAAPPERAGEATGLSETATELGGALGIAVLGSIGTAVYRSRTTVPAGVSPHDAAAATDTIGAAVKVAARLPAPLGASLLQASRDAFTQGLHAAAATGAAVALATALVAALLLRDRTTAS
jgi:DHA2 family multidrug resistance protein-like MFS transporter